MSDPTTNHPIQPRDYVRHRTWTPEHVGTLRIDDDGDMFVAWHGTCVEDQVTPDQVEKLTDEEKTAYIAAQSPGYDKGYMAMHLPEVFAPEGGGE